MIHIRICIVCLAALAAVGCDTRLPTLPPDIDAGANGLTAEQKRRAEQITSVFENDTIELQYAYVENLDDGRGYTAGRAGFTTATCDALEVIDIYSTDQPGNALAGYLPRLIELCDGGSDSVIGLEGFPAAWKAAAEDAEFRAAQDKVVSEFYYEPALVRARNAGIKSPLGVAAFYDAIIQHGDGDDPDGLQAMIDRASARAGGSPKTGIAEAPWLTEFLNVRRETLAFAFNPDTRDAWAMSADRPDVFEELLRLGNFEMEGPIVIDTIEHQATIP
jgi:chitosanase